MRTVRSVSSAWASRTRMPWRAAMPVPTISVAGVARPRAQGQAMTSTDTAFKMAATASPRSSHQASPVTNAITITAGTNTALTLSTSCWMGALWAWADSTRRTMRASCVSAPTAVVRTTTRPSRLSAPPVTCCPTSRATGRLSPVSSDSSRCVRPSMIWPSVGSRSPGRTTTSEPTRSADSGTSISTPSRRIRAVSGRRRRRASSDASVWRLARASIHLPSITSVMTVAALSKYRCGISPGRACHHSARLRPKAAVVPMATSRSMLPARAFRAAQPAR